MRRVERFFNPSALGKRAVSRPCGAVPEGLAGVAMLAPLFPGAARGDKAVAFHKALSNVQE
jgi:hypothetical protein